MCGMKIGMDGDNYTVVSQARLSHAMHSIWCETIYSAHSARAQMWMCITVKQISHVILYSLTTHIVKFFDKVGIYLPNPVFSYSQRCGS